MAAGTCSPTHPAFINISSGGEQSVPYTTVHGGRLINIAIPSAFVRCGIFFNTCVERFESLWTTNASTLCPGTWRRSCCPPTEPIGPVANGYLSVTCGPASGRRFRAFFKFWRRPRNCDLVFFFSENSLREGSRQRQQERPVGKRHYQIRKRNQVWREKKTNHTPGENIIDCKHVPPPRCHTEFSLLNPYISNISFPTQRQNSF